MNGINILVDTNVYINLLEKRGTVPTFIQSKIIHYSFITSMELLGKFGMTASEKQIYALILEPCVEIGFNDFIKNEVIILKQKYKGLKLPDAIIAATAIFMNLPLYTFDTDFEKINELDMVIMYV